ncbi:MAG TPA: hypothetical protein VGN01_02480 [Acidobacteriaceae bacterium]|jgi:hypothetical protein
MKKGSAIELLGCRTVEQGLLMRFTDGFYLFDTPFLLAHRITDGNKIPSASEWLRTRWNRKSPGLAGNGNGNGNGKEE